MNKPSTFRRHPSGMFPGQPTPRLYDRVVEVLRTRHYSRRTEEAYLHWIRRFLVLHNRTHPEDGYDIRTVQELLGHKDVETTMVCTHVLNRGGLGVHSPLDRLQEPMSVEIGRVRLNDWSA